VEVFFPRVGWLEFDPTHDVPQASASPGDSMPGVDLFRKLGAAISRVVPDAVPRALGDALRWVLASAAEWGPRLAVALVTIALGFVVARPILRRIRRWLMTRRLSRPKTAPPHELVPLAFRLVEEAGAQVGIPRQRSWTPKEYADALGARFPEVVERYVGPIVETLHREVYAGVDVDADEAATSEAAARRVYAVLAEISSDR
jgi:hypothetical protein